MKIDHLLSLLNAAKEKGATTVSFYRISKECIDNPKQLDFVVDPKLVLSDNLLVYGDPNKMHCELCIVPLE